MQKHDTGYGYVYIYSYKIISYMKLCAHVPEHLSGYIAPAVLYTDNQLQKVEMLFCLQVRLTYPSKKKSQINSIKIY